MHWEHTIQQVCEGGISGLRYVQCRILSVTSEEMTESTEKDSQTGVS